MEILKFRKKRKIIRFR